MRLNRDDIRINFEKKPYYFVNKEANIVECKLRFRVKYPVDVDDFLHRVVGSDEFYPNGIGNYETVKAYAFCGGKDEFDIEKGKKIAYTKAEMKVYNRVASRIGKVYAKYFEAIDICEGFFDKAYGVIEHDKDYLEKNF